MITPWFCQIDGVEYGPETAEQLRRMALNGRLSRDDLVRKGPEAPWVPANRVKGLFDGVPTVDRPAPPVPSVQTPKPREPPSTGALSNPPRPARQNAVKLRRLRLGLFLMYLCYVIALGTGPVLGVLFGILSVAGLRLESAVPYFVVCGVVVVLGGSLLETVGWNLCLFAPARLGGRGFLISSTILGTWIPTVSAFLTIILISDSVFSDKARWASLPIEAFSLASLCARWSGMLLFAFFGRAVSLQGGDSRCTQKYTNELILWFVIALVCLLFIWDTGIAATIVVITLGVTGFYHANNLSYLLRGIDARIAGTSPAP